MDGALFDDHVPGVVIPRGYLPRDAAIRSAISSHPQ